MQLTYSGVAVPVYCVNLTSSDTSTLGRHNYNRTIFISYMFRPILSGSKGLSYLTIFYTLGGA